MKRLIASVILATAVAVPLSVIAADDPGSRPPAPSARNPIDRTSDIGAGTFKSLDTNKDGYVSRNEAKNSAELRRQFGSLDTNGDGKLSSEELSGLRDATPSSMGIGGGSSAPVGPGGQPKSSF